MTLEFFGFDFRLEIEIWRRRSGQSRRRAHLNEVPSLFFLPIFCFSSAQNFESDLANDWPIIVVCLHVRYDRADTVKQQRP